jgi:hypoxanthine phosphoribosyltransferase
MKPANLAPPAPADLLFDWPAVDAALDQMAAEISIDLAGERPVYLIVMNGALMIAGCLAPRISVDLEFDYVHASRYRGELTGTSLVWYATPQSEMRGRTVLLVDDILDEGHTLAELRQYCYDRGAERVLIAVLAVKDHDRCVPDLKANYAGLNVPDRYVFGCGMDYRGTGRNLPGIYALKEA